MTKKYLVVNTTVKEARLDENGKDLRATIEKVGHAVKIDDNVTLNPGDQTILENVSNGQLKLMRDGYISIVETDGIGEILKQQVFNEKGAKSNKKVMQSTNGRVSEMGESVSYQTEHVDAGQNKISADPRVVKSRARIPNAVTNQRTNKTSGKGKKVS